MGLALQAGATSLLRRARFPRAQPYVRAQLRQILVGSAVAVGNALDCAEMQCFYLRNLLSKVGCADAGILAVQRGGSLEVDARLRRTCVPALRKLFADECPRDREFRCLERVGEEQSPPGHPTYARSRFSRRGPRALIGGKNCSAACGRRPRCRTCLRAWTDRA